MDQLDLFGGEDRPPPRREPPGEPAPCGVAPEPLPPPSLLVGACAWSHESWPGRFYPVGLPASRWLAYYARYCNAVEVDSSFYRVPTLPAVQRWINATPEGFRFALKAPRSVTHEAFLSLDGTTARTDWEGLMAAAEALGPRLASVLVQLGPDSTAFLADRLDRLLAAAPPGMPLAVEFRHPSWNTAEASALLAARGAVRAWGDHYLDPRRGIAEEAPHARDATGPFRYIRLLGDVSTKYKKGGGRHFEYGQLLFDREADKRRWVERLRPEVGDGTPVQIYINNHYEGFSILTAQWLARNLAAD